MTSTSRAFEALLDDYFNTFYREHPADATHVGFRVVRPLHEPTAQEQQDKWDKNLPQWNRKGDP